MEEIKNIFEKLDEKNKDILLLVAKAMEVSKNGVSVSVKQKLA